MVKVCRLYQRWNSKDSKFPWQFTPNYRDMIEFVNPLTLDESIRTEIHLYDQGKGKLEVHLEGK